MVTLESIKKTKVVLKDAFFNANCKIRLKQNIYTFN